MHAKDLFRAMMRAISLSLVMNAQAQTPPRDDSHWQPYSIGPDAEVYTIHTNPASFPLHMYVGGAFTNFEGMPANHVVRFNTEFWESLGRGVDGPVFAIASNLYPWNGVFVGGQFLNAINSDGSTVAASHIAFWDNSQRRWFPVGNGVDGEVLALALGGSGGTGGTDQLFVGGNFNRAHNGPVLNRIARFDLYNNAWQPLGEGVTDAAAPIVRTIVTAAIPAVGNFVRINKNLVYAGGRFTAATNPDGSMTSSRNLVLWNNARQRWQPLGNGLDEEVLALALGSNQSLYVGGRFTEAVNSDGSTTRFLNRLALWDGHYYHSLGYGVNGAVTTIAPSFDRNRIFVGGEFTEATNFDLTRRTARHIAVFNRNRQPHVTPGWDVLGNGVNGMVNSVMPVRPCPASSASEALHVAGAFGQAGNKNALGIAKWKYLSTTPTPWRGGIVIVSYSGRSRASGNARRSIVMVSRIVYIPPCSPGLGKAVATADSIILAELGFRESVELPELPYLEPFSLSVFDAENRVTPTTGARVEVTTFNPQLLMLMGVDDTTAYARNPDGFYTGETVMLHDLPMLTDNAGEVRAVFVHGVTDAPTIDIVSTSGDTLVRGLHYGGVSDPLSLAAGNHTVDLVRRSDKQNLGTYTFDVSDQANGYVALTLSGFLDPAANQNGAGMELGVYEIELAPPTAMAERNERAPLSFELLQNYPNPFNPVTSIHYALSREQFVTLRVHDVMGREVATLVNERQAPGYYRAHFDARGLVSGVYFIKMRAGDFSTGAEQKFTATRKILLLR